MKRISLVLLTLLITTLSCKKETKKEVEKSKAEMVSKETSAVKITPISHATAVLEFKNEVAYIDPTGGKKAFSGFDVPSYVIITDIHGDHMNMRTLQELDLSKATLIAPEAVINNLKLIKCKEKVMIKNNETKSFPNFSIEGIPMYNLREEALKFHPKGRGNGYVITIEGERIYFSGDTEDIPEMRQLKNIDKAFVCMNLPYTMTVESAASAVLDFEPKKVYPYHYRGTNGKSDVAKFKTLVNSENKDIEVVQLNWY